MLSKLTGGPKDRCILFWRYSERTLLFNHAGAAMKFTGAFKRCISLCLIAIVCPIYAQNQTIESAQAFISQVVGMGATSVELDFGDGWGMMKYGRYSCHYKWYKTGGGNVCGPRSSFLYQVAAYPVTSAVSVTSCATKITSPARSSAPYDTEEDRGGYIWHVFPNIPNGPFQVDWGSVAEVKQSGSSVLAVGTKPAFKFHFASEQLAARMTYAMEFLRLNCDKTSATGF